MSLCHGDIDDHRCVFCTSMYFGIFWACFRLKPAFTIKRVKPTRNWHCVNVPAIILEDHAAQVLQTNTRQDSCWRLDRIGFPAIVRHLQLDHIRILFHPISSYLILFHPISSYFQDVSQCFTIFFAGHGCLKPVW